MDSRKIKNITARKIFNVSVSPSAECSISPLHVPGRLTELPCIGLQLGFGEDVVVRLESLWTDLSSGTDKVGILQYVYWSLVPSCSAKCWLNGANPDHDDVDHVFLQLASADSFSSRNFE